MIEAKPNIKIDSNFKNELKGRILNEMSYQKIPYNNFSIFKYLLTFFSWVAVLSIVVFTNPSIFSWKSSLIIPSSSEFINLSFVPKVEKLDKDNAFWELAFNDTSSSQWWWLKNSSTNTMIQEKGDISSAFDAKRMVLPDPNYVQKEYVYNLKQWEILPTILESMFVYKSKTTSNGSINNSNISWLIKTDIIDTSKLNNLAISYLSIFEDTNEWYQLDLSLNEWIVNIFRNYSKWPQITFDQQKQLSISDIPSEESVIKTANDFINKYSINIESYFDPVVNNIWKKDYELTANKQDYYIPDILSVNYQFNIDWIWVYETYWYSYWLDATINVRDMKVSSLWPITKLDISWSKYDLITNSWEILDIARKWPYGNVLLESSVRSDMWTIWWWSSSATWGEWVVEWSTWSAWSSEVVDAPTLDTLETEKILVEIWNSKLVYLRKYVYNDKENVTEQYFVPWILFEVLTKSDYKKGIYPGEYITVPLVKSFLDNDNWGWMKVY